MFCLTPPRHISTLQPKSDIRAVCRSLVQGGVLSAQWQFPDAVLAATGRPRFKNNSGQRQYFEFELIKATPIWKA